MIFIKLWIIAQTYFLGLMTQKKQPQPPTQTLLDWAIADLGWHIFTSINNPEQAALWKFIFPLGSEQAKDVNYENEEKSHNL